MLVISFTLSIVVLFGVVWAITDWVEKRAEARRYVEEDEAPGCPYCYQETGETVSQLLDTKDVSWVCAKHDLGRNHAKD